MRKYAVVYLTFGGDLVLDIVEAKTAVMAAKIVIKRVNKDIYEKAFESSDEYRSASSLVELKHYMANCDEMIEVKTIK